MAITTTGASADGYAELSAVETYATNHFIGDDKTTWDLAQDTDKEAAIRQATQYIDSYFRDRFPGVIRSTSNGPAVDDRAGRVRYSRQRTPLPSLPRNVLSPARTWSPPNPEAAR